MLLLSPASFEMRSDIYFTSWQKHTVSSHRNTNKIMGLAGTLESFESNTNTFKRKGMLPWSNHKSPYYTDASQLMHCNHISYVPISGEALPLIY